MSVKPMELVKQSVNVIFFVHVRVFVCFCACACMELCVSVCVCLRACTGKTICQCFDSHVTRRGSVSGDPAMRTPDYPLYA